MLCLIARGVHLEERVKRSEAPETGRFNAYENFATQLNFALHRNDYESDIQKKEVTRMLDQILAERKHVVGKGGLVERYSGGRITRTTKRTFDRIHRLDFDGSLSEWKQGRRDKVMYAYMVSTGKLKPVDSMAADKDAVAPGQ